MIRTVELMARLTAMNVTCVPKSSFLCRNGADIGLAFKGECVDCSKYPPPKKGSEAACPKIYAPLCGTDGETYGNLCLLCAKIRKTGKQIGIRKQGECKEQVPQQKS
ncbi:ovomucoid-like [Sceloporus undulatus]|uniref:ovomucoid-like n=1 Tax=Sceloporus undulatus TaxID=8520 RepID=UPI001C4BE757|nr:ovomucoid-like [Sceloporus undulatus]